MLNVKTILVLSALSIGLSCSDTSSTQNAEQAHSKKTIQNKSIEIEGKRIDAQISESILIWKGHKIMGSHEGVLDLKSGYIIGDETMINGGTFVVDMTSIRAKTLMDGGDDHDKSELASHLRDGDFFDAPTYPTAKFVITSAKHFGAKMQITGEMTIKGVTQPIAFLSTWTNGVLKANIEIDRTAFNIKYGSGTFFGDLGDRAIKDKFSLDINIPFNI